MGCGFGFGGWGEGGGRTCRHDDFKIGIGTGDVGRDGRGEGIRNLIKRSEVCAWNKYELCHRIVTALLIWSVIILLVPTSMSY